jgi:hypothetical protein
LLLLNRRFGEYGRQLGLEPRRGEVEEDAQLESMNRPAALAPAVD